MTFLRLYWIRYRACIRKSHACGKFWLGPSLGASGEIVLWLCTSSHVWYAPWARPVRSILKARMLPCICNTVTVLLQYLSIEASRIPPVAFIRTIHSQCFNLKVNMKTWKRGLYEVCHPHLDPTVTILTATCGKMCG